MFVFLSVRLHIFTAPAARRFPRNCLSGSVGPADVVVAAPMIYGGEERPGLKWDTTRADTFRVGTVCVTGWSLLMNIHDSWP